MFTVGVDGSGLREVIPFGKGVSHFEWRNDREIMATFRFLPDSKAKQHVLFTDGKQDYRHVGEGFLVGDGHCSFAPDEEWMVTDENVSAQLQKRLLLYNVRTRQGAVLAAFPMRSREFMTGDLRRDLHPRWNRSGTAICFDALETGTYSRQLHIAELD